MSTRTCKWRRLIKQAGGRNVLQGVQKPAKVANVQKLIKENAS